MEKKQVKGIFFYGILIGIVLSILFVNPNISREQSAVLSRGSGVFLLNQESFVFNDIQYAQLKMLGFFALSFGFLGILLLSLIKKEKGDKK